MIEAAFLAVKKASEIIDMRKHKGEHPRMGATDVCPLIPVANITMEETVEYARKLAERIGNELDISVYCYENAALKPERRNLATCRSGEYEALPKNLQSPNGNLILVLRNSMPKRVLPLLVHVIFWWLLM